MNVYFQVEGMMILPLYSSAKSRQVHIWKHKKGWERGESPIHRRNGKLYDLNAVVPISYVDECKDPVKVVRNRIKKAASILPVTGGYLSVNLVVDDVWKLVGYGLIHDKRYPAIEDRWSTYPDHFVSDVLKKLPRRV